MVMSFICRWVKSLINSELNELTDAKASSLKVFCTYVNK